MSRAASYAAFRAAAGRRGSALLVVIGMLAFLIVSAVGFSTYMRYARLPSSYLRRTAATRLLAKAAVARAIEAVDAAVCNNPHPNLGGMYLEEIGDSGRRIVASSPGASRNANVWHHRVFAGTNDLRVVNASTISPDLVDYDTVTPLCMEALAYIPAPLVNEARAYSRVVPTAAWQSLGFDAGHIIAMQGPFTQEMNEATIRQYDIRVLITKDGGAAGGFRDKIEAARSTGIQVILIGRPEEEGMNAAQILAALEGESL